MPDLHLSSEYPPALASLLQRLYDATYKLNQEGSSLGMNQQHSIYWRYASEPNVRSICEIGFNTGVSAALWLTASKTARVNMFDIWSHSAAPVAERYLREHVPGADERLVIHKGPSHQTLAKAAASGLQCDLLSIDGGHKYYEALFDLKGMWRLASSNHTAVFMDDTNCQAPWCKPVVAALRDFNQSVDGRLEVVEAHSWHHHTHGYSKGLSVMRYPPHRRAE